MNNAGIYVLGFSRDTSRYGKPVDYVEISNRDSIGSNGHPVCSTRHRVATLDPAKLGGKARGGNMATVDARRKSMQVVWDVVGPAYEAWQNGQLLPTDGGTALVDWPALSKDRAAAFQAAGFRSIEEIAEASDTRIAKVRLPDARTVQASAREWLKGRDLAAVTTELAELRELLAKAGIEQTVQENVPETVEGGEGENVEAPKPVGGTKPTPEPDPETPAPQTRRRGRKL